MSGAKSSSLYNHNCFLCSNLRFLSLIFALQIHNKCKEYISWGIHKITNSIRWNEFSGAQRTAHGKQMTVLGAEWICLESVDWDNFQQKTLIYWQYYEHSNSISSLVYSMDSLVRHHIILFTTQKLESAYITFRVDFISIMDRFNQLLIFIWA